jgi:hypothetical protein
MRIIKIRKLRKNDFLKIMLIKNKKNQYKCEGILK